MAKKYITKDSGKREKHKTGAVRDIRSGKGRYDLISPLAVNRVAGVYERGSIKYNDRNWEKGMPIGRYLDSALRHTFQYIEGKRDEDQLKSSFEDKKPQTHRWEVRQSDPLGIDPGISFSHRDRA